MVVAEPVSIGVGISGVGDGMVVTGGFGVVTSTGGGVVAGTCVGGTIGAIRISGGTDG